MPKQPFTLEEFKAIYSKVPRLCVDIVVMADDGLLLTKRAIEPRKGFWHMPGGTVLLDEPVEEAAVRVAKEELGLDAKVESFLGYIEFFKEFKLEGGYGHALSLVYLCQAGGGEILLDRQADEYGYFRELPEKTVPEQKEFLRKSRLV